ncbi:hypothetical protein ACFXO2_10325 [Streptomyces sp. NPDC059152]|uniref:hypothetical protein n=1 Tax=Streptomyces sp. NPDC059152 TaxID=3346742 RepID=UPI003697B99C
MRRTVQLAISNASLETAQWTGPSSTEARAIFRAKEAQTLTPEHRERWWAAAFAEIGVDYDFPTLNITPVRREVAA